jgi:molybdenum cofactor guanylyltransferase
MGGGDKPMRHVGGRPLLDHVIARLKPQCHGLILNANGDPERFAAFGLPVIPDAIDGFAGPLAGILAGLGWVASHRPTARVMLSVAGDCPFLPLDLVTRLAIARAETNAPITVATSGNQQHHTIALWNISLRDELRHALVEENCQAVHRFAARYTVASVDWPTQPVDPFFNANTVEDLEEAERLAKLV